MRFNNASQNHSKHPLRTLAAITMLLATPLLSQHSLAISPEDRGLEISIEAKTRDIGWGDMAQIVAAVGTEHAKYAILI